MGQNIKSFQLKDFSDTKGVNYVISFMIDNNNTLYGTSENQDFYVGKIDEKLNIILFKVSNSPNPFITIDAFEGKLNLKNGTFGGDYWKTNINYEYWLEKIQNMSCNGNVYNKIIDQNISNLDLLLYCAYKSRCEKVKKIEEIVKIIRDYDFYKTNNKRHKVCVRVKRINK